MPRGLRVPSVWIMDCSIFWRAASLPLIKTNVVTRMSEMPLWGSVHKCLATGYWSLLSLTVRRCSVNLSAKRRLVSPIYSILQRTHLIQYIKLDDMQVKDSLMRNLPDGPSISVAAKTNLHVLHRLRLHDDVPIVRPALCIVVLTKRSLMLVSRL